MVSALSLSPSEFSVSPDTLPVDNNNNKPDRQVTLEMAKRAKLIDYPFEEIYSDIYSQFDTSSLAELKSNLNQVGNGFSLRKKNPTYISGVVNPVALHPDQEIAINDQQATTVVGEGSRIRTAGRTDSYGNKNVAHRDRVRDDGGFYSALEVKQRDPIQRAGLVKIPRRSIAILDKRYTANPALQLKDGAIIQSAEKLQAQRVHRAKEHHPLEGGYDFIPALGTKQGDRIQTAEMLRGAGVGSSIASKQKTAPLYEAVETLQAQRGSFVQTLDSHGNFRNVV